MFPFKVVIFAYFLLFNKTFMELFKTMFDTNIKIKAKPFIDITNAHNPSD